MDLKEIITIRKFFFKDNTPLRPAAGMPREAFVRRRPHTNAEQDKFFLK